MLRDLAENWFKSQCPPQAPISQFLQHIDTAIERGQNCWFRFGPGTTKDGPWLVYCYEDELFTIGLDKRQVSLLNLTAGEVITAAAGRRMRSNTNEEPPATLTHLEIKAATAERIAGSVEYKMEYSRVQPYCLRMTWDRPDGPGVNMFHYPIEPLWPTGKVQFEFQLRLPKGTPVPKGLVLVFFALTTVPQNNPSPFSGSRTRALSDTVAKLVELR